MNDIAEKNKPWSDEELKAALDAYLYMLQLEVSSIPFSVNEQSKVLLSGPLIGRSEASIHYRMRNISFVVSERGLPTLNAFSAAPQVGRNVMSRINSLLDARAHTVEAVLRLKASPSNGVSLAEVVEGLAALKNRIGELEGIRIAGIGHNRPPDSIDVSSVEIADVAADIGRIEREVEDGQPDTDLVRSLSQKVITFGLKVSVWCGQRLTDFAKASAVAAGTGFGLSMSGLGDQIIDTLKNLFQLVF